jgi:dTDP-4-amino-4,6-dideoxygalactose transaminase
MSTGTLSHAKETPAVSAVAKGKSTFPFLDLAAQFAEIRTEVMAAITRVMESQHFILGPEVAALEKEVAEFLGIPATVACASGSDALLLALMALGVGPADEVITTPFTFVATVGAIARLGAKPVFVDIDESFNIDPAQIESVITPRTRAIIPVHLFGLAADLDPIAAIAAQHALAVIEDAAQSIGARYKGRSAGTIGDFGCFSFFPSKNLGCAGDGGLMTANSPERVERLRLLRAHGGSQKYYYQIIGVNSRLDALQAAILRVKLRHLQDWNEARQAKADIYRQLFAETGLQGVVTLPHVPADRCHVYNQFSIRCKDRDALREFLSARGLPTEIYYPLPLHLQPAFEYLGYKAGQLPKAEAASQEVLALPIHPELPLQRQELIVASIGEFYRARP